MSRESREVWRKRVERWADSGLSAKEFAGEIGVNANTLAHWKWLLGQKPVATGPRQATAPCTGFVEVVAPLVSAEAPSPGAEPFELVLPGGLVVRVPVHFDAAALRRVVDALGTR